MKKIIAIVGPTATGKSLLAVKLAKKIKGEIISADSRQVYKDLNIGTGKVTKKEMKEVPHYLLNVVSPKKIFTADDFLKLGSRAINKIEKNNRVPIVAGGTGFYIDALLGRITFPHVPPNLRLRKKLEKHSLEELYKMLYKLDSKRAKAVQKQNKRRLIRAIEIILSDNQKLQTAHHSLQTSFKVLWIGLTLANKPLKKKIRKRFIHWLKQGLVLETKKLAKQVSKKRLKEIGLSYPIIAGYLEDKLTRDEMIERSVNSIYHYAKRQKTWFKRNKNIHWIKTEAEALGLVSKFLNK